MLTSGNANLLMAHGTPLQQEVFAKNEFAGRWFGTMCLSRAAGRLVAVRHRDARRARRRRLRSDPLGPRYRLRGNKMWISAGEHELTENIVHLVLAKIPGAGRQADARHQGHLAVHRAEEAGRRARPNSPASATTSRSPAEPQAGLPRHHQHAAELRRRQVPVRGEAGAVGYLVGKPGEGLRCMFHMMNEARIGVGLGAVMLGYAGYEASLDYARNAPAGPAGRHRRGKDAAQPQVRIIEHADVKRMLLAQKSYVEGALALELYCARLVDEQHTGDAEARARAAPAARGADADRQELAERVVPGGQQPGDPGARRLRLHARLPGRAVLARQPPEHDPRGHARHPGARPARAARW